MNLQDFSFLPLYTIDKKWALLTAGNISDFNTMTVSWGEMGTLWGKPVVTVYVRPSRYTNEFMQKNDYFTLSFFEDKYKKDLGILGSKSGKNEDKLSFTNLTPNFILNGISFKEANLTLICKKLYVQQLDINSIPEETKDRFYRDESAHYMYIGEVIDIIDKRSKN